MYIDPHRETPMHPELRRCAELSLEAYSDMPGRLAQKFQNKFTSAEFFVIDADKVYLVHKGTMERRDVLIDLLACPVRYLKTWVHGGFALQHKSVKKKLRKIFEKVKDSGKPLIITGHSLGAAQASLSMLMAQQMGISATLVCFGKPRVYLKKKRSRFPKGSVLSVCSGSDIVTRLPRFLYTVGCQDQDFLYLANDNNNYLNPKPEFVESDFSIKDAVSDHSMELYLQRALEVV